MPLESFNEPHFPCILLNSKGDSVDFLNSIDIPDNWLIWDFWLLIKLIKLNNYWLKKTIDKY